jgi:myo-inositol-1(or 4)-monophosphatase
MLGHQIDEPLAVSADIVESRLPVAEYMIKTAGSMVVDCFHHTMRTADYVGRLQKAIEALAIKNILQSFPDDGYAALMDGSVESRNGITWIINPIDGMNNFMRGMPMVGVQLSIESRGTTLYSSMYQPLSQEQTTAQRGLGTMYHDYKNGQELSLKVSDTGVKDACIVFTGNLGRTELSQHVFEAIAPHVAHTRVLGVAVMDFSLLAAGKVDAVIGTRVQYRDVAPGVLVVQEAGGAVTDLEGNPFSAESTTIIASNSTCHADIIALLKDGHAL